jgi:D-3-phosphoglycerate dehydrogenase
LIAPTVVAALASVGRICRERRKEETMTSSKRVLLPERIQPEAVEILEEAGCELVNSPDPKPETVASLMKDVQAIVLRTGVKMNRELLSHGDELCIISRTGAGYDNVDVEAATEKGVIVVSTLGVNSPSVVEHAIALMLALFKQLFLMDREVRKGNFAIRRKNLPRDTHGKILGIMGLGGIGLELARICHQVFGMKIIATTGTSARSVRIREENKDWVEFVDTQGLFSKSDMVSVHIPLRDNTRHAVGEREISWMKPDAFLINTSRGPVIDESALIKALQEMKIAGAGLDVFSEEPLREDNPLLTLDNVILTPHSAALTKECVIKVNTEAARYVVDLFNGIEPPNIANRQVLASDRWKHLESPDDDA